MGKNIKVFCKKTGQEFLSFKEAGRELEVAPWTLSKKIETNGFFVDKEGNRWERETPMRSKNKYKKTTPYYKKMKQRLFAHRKANEPTILKGIEQAQKRSEMSCPVFVRKAVAQHIKQAVKNSGVWEDICEAMDFLGVEFFVITREDNDN